VILGLRGAHEAARVDLLYRKLADPGQMQTIGPYWKQSSTPWNRPVVVPHRPLATAAGGYSKCRVKKMPDGCWKDLLTTQVSSSAAAPGKKCEFGVHLVSILQALGQ
jgi:hypothetical protein